MVGDHRTWICIPVLWDRTTINGTSSYLFHKNLGSRGKIYNFQSLSWFLCLGIDYQIRVLLPYNCNCRYKYERSVGWLVHEAAGVLCLIWLPSVVKMPNAGDGLVF
jgi:hypothetical protein